MKFDTNVQWKFRATPVKPLLIFKAFCDGSNSSKQPETRTIRVIMAKACLIASISHGP
jgi:hypothetical protein